MLRLKPLAALFLVSVAWGSAWANEGSCDDVKEIPRHQRIKVIATDMKSVEGRFANATDDAIIVRVGRSEERISRPNVLRVTLVGRRKAVLMCCSEPLLEARLDSVSMGRLEEGTKAERPSWCL